MSLYIEKKKISHPQQFLIIQSQNILKKGYLSLKYDHRRALQCGVIYNFFFILLYIIGEIKTTKSYYFTIKHVYKFHQKAFSFVLNYSLCSSTLCHSCFSQIDFQSSFRCVVNFLFILKDFPNLFAIHFFTFQCRCQL